jgi:hypothetical protein
MIAAGSRQITDAFYQKYMSTRLEPTPFFPNVGNHYDTAPPIMIEPA